MDTQLIEIAREVAALLPGQWTAHVNEFPEQHNGFPVRIERTDGIHILMNVPDLDDENIHYTLETGIRQSQFYRITGVVPWGLTKVARGPKAIARTLRSKYVHRLDDLLAEARPIAEAENAEVAERGRMLGLAAVSQDAQSAALRTQVHAMTVAQPTFGNATAWIDSREEVTVSVAGLNSEQFVRVASALAAVGVPTHMPQS